MITHFIKLQEYGQPEKTEFNPSTIVFLRQKFTRKDKDGEPHLAKHGTLILFECGHECVVRENLDEVKAEVYNCNREFIRMFLSDAISNAVSQVSESLRI